MIKLKQSACIVITLTKRYILNNQIKIVRLNYNNLNKKNKY